MRYFIFANPDEKSQNLKKFIINELNNKDFSYDEETPSLVISIGGDGCMLRSIHHFEHNLNGTSFVGVSTGSLGFLCDFKDSEVNKLIDRIISNSVRYEANKLLEVTYDDKKMYFFNEFRLEKIFSTLKMDVYINGNLFENFRGSGICIATPFGSTGYNKSIGGPIVHPRLPSLIYGKIAPIDSKLSHGINSFMLFRHYDKITLKGVFDNCIFGGDNTHMIISDNEEKSIEITTSQLGVIFARYRSADYYERVKRSF